jgi:hypothetical protein
LTILTIPGILSGPSGAFWKISKKVDPRSFGKIVAAAFISIAPPFTCSTVKRKRGNFFRRGSSFEFGYIIRALENFENKLSFLENSKKVLPPTFERVAAVYRSTDYFDRPPAKVLFPAAEVSKVAINRQPKSIIFSSRSMNFDQTPAKVFQQQKYKK